MNNIGFGMMMVPCFENEEKFKEGMKSTDFYIDKDFHKTYSRYTAALSIVAGCAKIFILENYQKVKSWDGLSMIMHHNKGKVEFYFHEERPRRRRKDMAETSFDKLWKRMDDKNKEKHNPVVTLTNVVLDTSDWDFSLTINGEDYLWICNESCILIADFIEKKLKEYEQADV